MLDLGGEAATMAEKIVYLPEGADFRDMARALGAVVNYQAGATVFREGDAPSHMYMLLSGIVETSRHGKVIEQITPGNALGIVALLDDEPRTITALALQNCELAIIDRKRFRYMVEAVPNFVWYVMSELVGRLKATNAAL
jgi:CRP/FNR family transcriptional regulator, cyclic AMP receptor protein